MKPSPCGHCGSRNLGMTPITRRVFCHDCHAMGPSPTTHPTNDLLTTQDGIEKWNQRVPVEPK